MNNKVPISVSIPPRGGAPRMTPSEAIAVAAAAGIALHQPDPCSAWLADAEGRPVFWWAAGGCLYLRPFANPEPARC